MIALRVTPPAKEEGTEVDGAKEVGGATILDLLERSCASLRLTVVASMAHITWKWLETRKGTEKWRKILVIAKGKMSLSQVAVSLYTSMMERMKWKESKGRTRGELTITPIRGTLTKRGYEQGVF